jgi:hypothetical protein
MPAVLVTEQWQINHVAANLHLAQKSVHRVLICAESAARKMLASTVQGYREVALKSMYAVCAVESRLT